MAASPAAKVGDRMKRSDFTPEDIAGDIIHEGYLSKQKSKGLKGWQQRYFVLTRTSLRYYEKEENKAEGILFVKGTLSLGDLSDVAVSEAPSGKMDVNITVGGEVLTFRAQSAVVAQGWRTALSKLVPKGGKNPAFDSGGKAMGDPKDSEDFEYLTYATCPEWNTDPADKLYHKSLMAKTCTPELFDKLKDRTTASGYTFSNAIQTGTETPHLGVGITAGDEECYELFKEIINPVIAGWHGGYDPTTMKHPTDLEPENLKFSDEQKESFNKYVASTRIRAARNIRGKPLPPGSTRESAAEVESILKTTFEGLEGDLKGTYYPLGGMDATTEADLQSQGFLFQKPKTTNLLTNAGAARFWPESRGIFHNDSKTALAWCNEEDHCRIISMGQGGDVKDVFARFCALSNAVKASAEGAGAALMWNETHGFLGSCPSNIGTGLRASVMAVLPELTKNTELLEKVCDKYDLQPRGSAGEHSAAEGGKWDISNKQRIGFSEVQLVQKMIDGVSKVIEIEEKLAGGASVADILKLLSRKAIRGSLVKKSTGFSLGKRWQEREFDFDPDTHILRYSNAGKVLGSINTDGCTIERLPSTKKGEEFRFKVIAKEHAEGSRDELPLQASSEAEMEDWISSIEGTDSAHAIHAAGAVLDEVAEEGGGAAAAKASTGISPELREKFVAAGQEQVFKFVDNGVNTEAQNAELAAQLEGLDLERIAKLHAAAMEYDAKAAAGEAAGTITPLDSAGSVEGATQEQRDAWTKTGMDALSRGEVAALVLSGGQGTRLGFAGPKGKYDIQLPSGKTLFQLFGERLNKLQQLANAHQAEGEETRDVKIPFCIMTSPMNHDETTSFFAEKENFGLDAEHVHFFPQGTLPCMTNDGKLMLESGWKVGAASDGNGGIYSALKDSGVLDKLKAGGIKYVHVFSVDNAICRVADPMFMGYCITEGADCGNKVVWKTAPDEKVGVVARRDGAPHVIEYSEITKEMSEEVDEAGKLKYGAGNICNHFYTVDMLDRVTDDALIFHVARKQIPVPNEKGEPVKPEEKNGIKLECFIFDAFPLSTKMAVLEGARMDEFSPVKNAPNKGLPDSPDTARAMLSEQHVRWAKEAGATVVPGDRPFEISPLQSYAGEGLEEQLKGQTIDLSSQ